MSTANPFSGALALFSAGRHVVTQTTLWGGLALGIVSGLLILSTGSDGREHLGIFLATGRSGLVRLDLETGESTTLAENSALATPVLTLTYDPTGASGLRAVLAWKEGSLSVIDTATGALSPLGATDRTLWDLALHGDRVFGLDDANELRWFDAAGGPSQAAYPR